MYQHRHVARKVSIPVPPQFSVTGHRDENDVLLLPSSRTKPKRRSRMRQKKSNKGERKKKTKEKNPFLPRKPKN